MSFGGAAYGQPQSRSKVLFVGNLPFDYTEEQFVEVFNSVGPVVSFRLVFDHASGKPKGFGFCEYRDADTAASAIRNLQGVEVGGRGLRLDFADTDDAPPSKRFRGGPGGPPPMGGAGPAGYGGAYGGGGGAPPPAPGGYNGYQPLGGAPAAPPAMQMSGAVAAPPPGGYNIPPPVPGATGPRPLPQGVPVEPGKQATDKITETIGTMAPGQLLDIMSQMKALVTASPYEARALLTAQPQLSYALFQAMLCMGIVDPSVLQRAFPSAGGAAPAAPAAPPAASAYPSVAPAAAGGYGTPAYGTPPHQAPAGGYGAPIPPPHQQQQQQPPSSYSRPPGAGPASYNGPPQGAQTPQQQQQQQVNTGYGNYQRPPPPPQQPMQQQQAAPGTTPEQAALIQQVLSMTDAQIAALDETSRNTILQIRQQAQRAMGR
ncbi:hypothetical protein JCM10450v2_002717 [Rhodotorula kratochvilovae]